LGPSQVMLESGSTSGEFKGTLLYAAPERFDRARFGEVNWRTDMYQVSAVAYETLTGQQPFTAGARRIDVQGYQRLAHAALSHEP